MSKIDQNYHKLLEEILWTGYKYPDPNRTGVERIEISSYTFKHDFKDGFPAISTKKLHYKNVVTELIWFLRGNTNIKYLVDNGCNIWNKDAYNYYVKQCNVKKVQSLNFKDFIVAINENINDKILLPYELGDLGPVYGKQWRDFGDIDQIKDLIQGLKDKPLGTEHIVTAWNPGEKFKMALPACHYGFQIVVRPLKWDERQDLLEKKYNNNLEQVRNKYKEASFIGFRKWTHKDALFVYKKENICEYGFELHWSQRSVDTFLGLPYNIASYATLALLIEKWTGYKALGIQGDLKKVHLYDNSIDAVNEQLSRDVNKHKSCILKIIPDIENTKETLDDLLEILNPEDFELINYESDPAIKVEMLERDE